VVWKSSRVELRFGGFSEKPSELQAVDGFERSAIIAACFLVSLKQKIKKDRQISSFRPQLDVLTYVKVLRVY
jgi:hypothetical protein